MILLRECMAVCLFCSGFAGIYLVLAHGFDAYIVGATIIAYLMAYLIWPSKRKGQRQDDSRFSDILEILIEFPLELFFWIIRLLGRLLGGKGDGIDIGP